MITPLRLIEELQEVMFSRASTALQPTSEGQCPVGAATTVKSVHDTQHARVYIMRSKRTEHYGDMYSREVLAEKRL